MTAPRNNVAFTNPSPDKRYFLKTEQTYITLEEEMRIVEAYLEIEALRLGGKLTTEIHIDPRAKGELIPILSVEPLVENAVKHGVAAHSGPGTVRVTARWTDAAVEIEVRDSGRGGKSDGGAGVGLANVRRRLKLCYGDQSGLVMESNETGTRVSFRVPVKNTVGVSS